MYNPKTILITFVCLSVTLLSAANTNNTSIILQPDAITIPKLLNYQGKLTNTSGAPVTDSTYSITFRLFITSSSGLPFWSETQNVPTNNGIFNVLLGSVTPIESIPQSGNCYLEMQVNPNPAMTPRIRITSSAYAYLSKKSDTANYALSANVQYVDSARIATTAHKLQGKDTIALSVKFVDEGQINAVTSTMIIDNAVTSNKIQDSTIQITDLSFTPATRPLSPGVATTEIQDNAVTSEKIQDNTITRNDVTTNFKSPYADTADYSRNINVTYVDSSRISANAHKLQGKDTIALSTKFVDEGQTNAISSTMIIDNTITRNDVTTNFKSPYADTSDFARNTNVQYVDSARIASNSYNAFKLQGKDTISLSVKFVDEGQTNAITNSMIVDNAITTGKIQDNTITRNDVTTNFKSPYADTADYSRNINVTYVDSSRIALNAYNAYKLQNYDTTNFDARYVNEAQTNSVSSAMIADGTISRNDVAPSFKAPYSDTAEYARATPPVGVIDSARVAVFAYNAYKLQGQDTTNLDARYINEAQTNSISTNMLQNLSVTNAKLAANSVSTDKIVDGTIGEIDIEDGAITYGKIDRDAVTTNEILNGTITRNDVAANFKAPYADTADYVRIINVSYVDSARVSTNSHKLQGKDTIALSTKFVDEAQPNSITNSMIVNNAVTSDKIQDGTIQVTDLSFIPATRPFSPLISGSEIAKPCTLSANVAQYDAVLNVNNNGTGYAIKVNSNSDGIIVDNTAGAGVVVNNSNQDGFFVGNADWSGLYIVYTDGDAIYVDSSNSHGININKADGTGIYIYQAADGFEINSAESNGLWVGSAGWLGLGVGRAAYQGLRVYRAGENGVYVDSAGQYGVHAKGAAGGVYGQSINGFGVKAVSTNGDALVVDGKSQFNGDINSTGKATFGETNSNSGNYSFVTGKDNNVSGYASSICGGDSNQVTYNYSHIGSGKRNAIFNNQSAIGGGTDNTIHNQLSFIGGGAGNYIEGGDYSTIAGGEYNTCTNHHTFIGGGAINIANGEYSSVICGNADSAYGDYSIIGGKKVKTDDNADYTFAFGRDFKTSTPGAVVFYDRTTNDEIKLGIDTTEPTNIITVRQNSPTDPIADAWTTYSSKRWKENIKPIDEPINKVMKLRGVYYDWKETKKHDIGLIAEEVGEVIPEVVAYEENGIDAKSVDYARLVSLLIEAIKQQQQQINDMKKELQELKQK